MNLDIAECRKFALFVLLSAALVGAPMMASAAPGAAPCGCSQPLPAKSGSIGVLTAVRGDVLITGRGGMSRARDGSTLAVGTRIIAGRSSGAEIVLGRTCKMSIVPDSTTTVVASNGAICVETVTASNPGDGDTRFSSNAVYGQTLAAAGAANAGAGAGAAAAAGTAASAGVGAAGAFAGISTAVVVTGAGALAVGGIAAVAVAAPKGESEQEEESEADEIVPPVSAGG